MYRISANSFRGNYSFLNLTLCTVTFDHSTYRCENYSREETIQVRKLFAEIRYVYIFDMWPEGRIAKVFPHQPIQNRSLVLRFMKTYPPWLLSSWFWLLEMWPGGRIAKVFPHQRSMSIFGPGPVNPSHISLDAYSSVCIRYHSRFLQQLPHQMVA